MKILNSKIEKFVAKRAAALACIMAVTNIIFLEKKWFVLAGLVAGCVLAILRFSLLAGSISGLLSRSTKKTIVTKSSAFAGYLMNLLILGFVLAISLKFNIWLGAGVIAGILTVPLIIFIYSLTEGLGITHNNFE